MNIQLTIPGIEDERVALLKKQLSALSYHLDKAMNEEMSLETMHYRMLLQSAIELTAKKLEDC